MLIKKKPATLNDDESKKPPSKRKAKTTRNQDQAVLEPDDCAKKAVVVVKKFDLDDDRHAWQRERSPSLAAEYKVTTTTAIFTKTETSEPLKPPPPAYATSQASSTLFTWLLVFLLIFLIFAIKSSSFLVNMSQVSHYYLKAVLMLVAFCLIFKAFHRYLAPLCTSSTQILFYGTISFLALFGLLIVFVMFFFGCIFLDYCKLNINLNYSTNSNIFAAFEMHKMFASIF